MQTRASRLQRHMRRATISLRAAMRLVDALVVVRVTISEGREGRRRGGEQQSGVEDEGRGGGEAGRDV